MPWLLLLVLSSPAPPQNSVLLERIHALIEGREVGLVLLPLDGRDAAMIEPDKTFHPEGTPIAHKTGTITKIHHDAAIVYGPRPYVLAILVRGIQEQKESAALMAALSREVWTSLEK